MLSDVTLGIPSPWLFPFPVIPQLLFLFSLELRQHNGQIDSLLFLHPSLRTHVCSRCLPICPISSGNEQELSRHRAFGFSIGDVANAVTVI